MTDYTELVKALRCGTNRADKNHNCEKCRYYSNGCLCTIAMDDAAAAIEELQAQLPKQGEIVRCGECKWYGIYYAKKDGSPDKRYRPSVCLRGKYAKRRDPDWFCADGERRAKDGQD